MSRSRQIDEVTRRDLQKARIGKVIRASIDIRREASFVEWWREGRSHCLRPRSQNMPTADERMRALHDSIIDDGGVVIDVDAKAARTLEDKHGDRAGPVELGSTARTLKRHKQVAERSASKLYRSHVISHYDVPQYTEASSSSHRRSSPQLCSIGHCYKCGDSLSTQMHVDAGGTCRESDWDSPTADSLLRFNDTNLDGRPTAGRDRVLMKPTLGLCVRCGDSMSTNMHLLHGPCGERATSKRLRNEADGCKAKCNASAIAAASGVDKKSSPSNAHFGSTLCGSCPGCGDSMATQMHLDNGPCI